ncbi:MAG: prephenate dehydrogenase [Bacilli bacterium]|nr:prephenate dehydrogenase [Bacilli bacterium]
MSKKILIVGLGLIGGSYAMGLKKKGYEVYAIARRQDSIDYAIKNEIIDGGQTDVTKELVSSFDRVVISVYPKVLLSWLEEYKDFFKEGTIITDVTGIKCEVVYKIQDMLPSGVEFIGAHPMAGREVYGVENANDAIFKNANYIVTPTDKNTAEAIDFAKEIGALLEFKNISILSPEEHDRMIAFLSQLTHCIAVSLMTCKDNTHLHEYTGDSFRDLTRIANINENMWSELFLMNKDVLVKEMDCFLDEFKNLRDLINNEDVEAIKDKMRLSSTRRSYFNKKA